MPPNEALHRLETQALERVAALKHAVEQVGRLRVPARSADGLVQVEVGSKGQLCGLWLDDAVYDGVPPGELAEVIIGLVRSAETDAAERVVDIMARLLPGDLPALPDWWQRPPGGESSAVGSGDPEC